MVHPLLLCTVTLLDQHSVDGRSSGSFSLACLGTTLWVQVTDPAFQHKVMIEAVENHMPEVIVIDEIGTELECLASRTIAQRGVQLIATAHGSELENLVKNPSLSDLVSRPADVCAATHESNVWIGLRNGSEVSVIEKYV